MDCKNICRLCSTTLTSGGQELFTDQKVHLKKIVYYFRLELLPGDGVPMRICSNCSFELENIDSFKERCIQSQKSLVTLLNECHYRILSDALPSQIPKVTESTSSSCDANAQPAQSQYKVINSQHTSPFMNCNLSPNNHLPEVAIEQQLAINASSQHTTPFVNCNLSASNQLHELAINAARQHTPPFVNCNLSSNNQLQELAINGASNNFQQIQNGMVETVVLNNQTYQKGTINIPIQSIPSATINLPQNQMVVLNNQTGFQYRTENFNLNSQIGNVSINDHNQLNNQPYSFQEHDVKNIKKENCSYENDCNEDGLLNPKEEVNDNWESDAASCTDDNGSALSGTEDNNDNYEEESTSRQNEQQLKSITVDLVKVVKKEKLDSCEAMSSIKNENESNVESIMKTVVRVRPSADELIVGTQMDDLFVRAIRENKNEDQPMNLNGVEIRNKEGFQKRFEIRKCDETKNIEENKSLNVNQQDKVVSKTELPKKVDHAIESTKNTITGTGSSDVITVDDDNETTQIKVNTKSNDYYWKRSMEIYDAAMKRCNYNIKSSNSGSSSSNQEIVVLTQSKTITSNTVASTSLSSAASTSGTQKQNLNNNRDQTNVNDVVIVSRSKSALREQRPAVLQKTSETRTDVLRVLLTQTRPLRSTVANSKKLPKSTPYNLRLKNNEKKDDPDYKPHSGLLVECPVCDRTFNSVSKLTDHMKNTHYCKTNDTK